MGDALYDLDSAWIALALLVAMALAMEAGYRVGVRGADDAKRGHIDAIQSATLGILALLLGFTFSLALQRYDSRSEAVVDEANAIGTALLRVRLVAPPQREAAAALLREYLDARIADGGHALNDRAARQALAAKAAALQERIWAQAQKALDAKPDSYPTALFAESVNTMIDSYGKRDAALRRHVPALVLALLYATFLMAGGIVGLAAGSAGHRPSLASHVLVLLIVVLVFVILDLDRPRRGLIQVSQQPLVDLRASVTPPAS